MIVRVHIGRAISRSAMVRSATTALIAAALAGAVPTGIARPAVAQGTAAPSAVHQPSPAALSLAKQILELKHVENIFKPLIRGVVIKTRDVFMQTNFMWGKDLNEIAANLEKEYSVRTNELLDRAARIYATHFSEPELKQLLSFYQSPLGQKVIDEEPKALDESMAMAGTWADEFSQDVINKMRAEMKKRGHDL
ncbi:MAG TPA: DUF2059 domain-containing protein [Xanthobacteraceae bacterium]|jgi:hypothetical protein|nr:DUF2059 domain-containing protein [Xanthobacteraceae bacterium]